MPRATPLKRPASASSGSSPAKKPRTKFQTGEQEKVLSIPTPARQGLKPAASKSPSQVKSLSDGMALANGVKMPVVGYGTYKLKDNEVAKPVEAALKAGYRLIDTAQVYDNERGIAAAIKNAGVPREELFIETKVWRSSHGKERTLKAFKQTAKRLGVDYIDLYLIHWPGAKTGWPLPRGQVCPPEWTPSLRDTGTWKAMEELYEEGKVKAIGVSNYSVRHLQQLLRTCKIKPMVNQVEFHPHLVQTELLDFCHKHGIAVQAYGSLGSSDARQAEAFFSFPPVQEAAKAHRVTPAQVLLRWALQKQCMVIPKSTRPERMAQNAKVFDFQLSAKEVKAIDALHCGSRYSWKGLDPDTIE